MASTSKKNTMHSCTHIYHALKHSKSRNSTAKRIKITQSQSLKPAAPNPANRPSAIAKRPPMKTSQRRMTMRTSTTWKLRMKMKKRTRSTKNNNKKFRMSFSSSKTNKPLNLNPPLTATALTERTRATK